jgi:ferredoxin
LKIDKERCVECRSYIIYCPVGAIKTGDEVVYIDQGLCVEYAACLKSGTCGQGALRRNSQ